MHQLAKLRERKAQLYQRSCSRFDKCLPPKSVDVYGGLSDLAWRAVDLSRVNISVDVEAPREALRALVRTDLSSFIQRAVNTVDPGSLYLHNWHIDAIAHQLVGAKTNAIGDPMTS